jgi:signal peptidase I
MVSAQVSLFDTAAVIKPTYKIGDRVKVRKKPIAASYIKKGDIVEIDVVHPINHSIKFWNERSERWEFLHPDEIGNIVLDDSVSKGNAQIADTEYTVQVASDDDSVSKGNAQIADTEYTVQFASDDDSVSKGNAQIADTEYTVQVASDDDSVSKGNAQIVDTEYTVPLADDDSVSKAVSTYKPRGTACSGEYFRFSYREGSRMRHIHIRGGNTDSPIAQAKVQEVRSRSSGRNITCRNCRYDPQFWLQSSDTFVRLMPEAAATCE